jgi:glucose-1-phosphate adenylyltransferase
MNLVDQFGVIEVDQQDPTRIAAFVEKPKTTPGLPDDPNSFLASMGNYVFTADALVKALEEDAARLDTKHDMGGDIIPHFVDRNDAAVYDFTTNLIPGSTDRDRQYWRDVGTMDSYYDANMDLISPLPLFNLYNLQWPIYTRQSVSRRRSSCAAPRPLRRGPRLDRLRRRGHLRRHRPGLGAGDRRLRRGERRGDRSVLMDKVSIGPGAIVRRAIIDKNVKIPPGATHRRGPRARSQPRFAVTDSGLTILSKGQVIPPG